MDNRTLLQNDTYKAMFEQIQDLSSIVLKLREELDMLTEDFIDLLDKYHNRFPDDEPVANEQIVSDLDYAKYRSKKDTSTFNIYEWSESEEDKENNLTLHQPQIDDIMLDIAQEIPNPNAQPHYLYSNEEIKSFEPPHKKCRMNNGDVLMK